MFVRETFIDYWLMYCFFILGLQNSFFFFLAFNDLASQCLVTVKWQKLRQRWADVAVASTCNPGPARKSKKY